MTALTWRQAVIPAPRPQGAVGMPLAAPLGLPEAMHEVELVQEAGRHRHGPVDALAALLEGREHDRPAGEVDSLGGQRQGLGDAAARDVQHYRRGSAPAWPHGPRRGSHPLVGGEIEALAPASCSCIVVTEHITSVTAASAGPLPCPPKTLILGSARGPGQPIRPRSAPLGRPRHGLCRGLEANLGMGAVAQRLLGRRTAAAQSDLALRG